MKLCARVLLLVSLVCLPTWAQPIRPSAGTLRATSRLQTLIAQGKLHLSTHTADQARVDRIGQRVAAVCRRPVPWTFYLCTEATPNAFTLGEGVVVVTEGLLKLNLDDDELAGVLAHEVGHGAQQHLEYAELQRTRMVAARKELIDILVSKRALDRERQSGGLSDGDYQSKLYPLARRMEDLETQVKNLSDQARYSSEFSQEQEIEADSWGMRYAVAAGFSQDGLEHALEKLLAYGINTSGASFNGGGLTHPPIARRIEVLHRVEASMNRSR
jgi:predicted Zn-dependent protease